MIKDSREEFNMRGPEQRFTSQSPASLGNKGIFPVTTAEKPAAAPRVAPVEEKTKPKEKHLSKKALIARLGGTLLALAGTGGPAVHHHINNEIEITPPAIGRDIASIPSFYWNLGQSAVGDISRLFNKEKEAVVPPTFDNKADSAVIKAGVNTVRATNEDLAKIQDNITFPPNPTEEHGLPALPQFTLLTPFLLKDGEQISMSKTYNGPGIETATGKVVEPRYSAAIKYVIPTKGTEIIPGIVDPKAVSMEIFKNRPSIINGKEYFGGVTILVTRQDGTQYDVGFSSHEDVRSLVPLPILDDAPTYVKGQNLKGLPITGTIPIMKTGIDNARIGLGASRISSSNSVNDLFFSDIQLFQSLDSKALLPPLQP